MQSLIQRDGAARALPLTPICRICDTGRPGACGILAAWMTRTLSAPPARDTVLVSEPGPAEAGGLTVVSEPGPAEAGGLTVQEGCTDMTTPTEKDVMAVQDKLAELYATLPPAQREVLDTILAA